MDWFVWWKLDMWALEEDGDGSKMAMGNNPCDTKDQFSCNWSWQ
jgi:hypothetical protein